MLKSARLIQPSCDMVIEILLRIVIGCARTRVARRNSMDEAGYDDEFLVLALGQFIMDLVVTDEVVGSHRIE